MKIRAITVGINLGFPFDKAALAKAAEFCHRAKERIAQRGLEVQTLRVAGSRVNSLLSCPGAILELAQRLDEACQKEQVNLGSVGCLEVTEKNAPSAFASELSPALAKTERVFASVLAASKGRPLNRAAVLECAKTVLQISRATAQGFGGRRFAVGANVPPHGPFFPTGYHDGGPPAFSLAVEAAAVAVEVFQGKPAIETAGRRLATALEERCRPLEEVARELESRYGLRYLGIDLSLAPFPTPAVSIAGAIEALGGGTFGAPGTLSAVRIITEAIAKVRVKKCGFSGVMLPVLEDSVLLTRVAEGKVTLDQLLLYSAVCGTGLDTIPLPGDASEEQLAAIILDVCTLSLALNKPLTARLMPIPGKRAGEWTEFQSPYFGNTRIMALPSDFMRKFFGPKRKPREAKSRPVS